MAVPDLVGMAAATRQKSKGVVESLSSGAGSEFAGEMDGRMTTRLEFFSDS